jgi:hypothetical protein
MEYGIKSRAFFLHPLRVLFGISDIYPELAQFVTK